MTADDHEQRDAIKAAVQRECWRIERRLATIRTVFSLFWWFGLAYGLPKALATLFPLLMALNDRLRTVDPGFAFDPETTRLMALDPAWPGYVAAIAGCVTLLVWLWGGTRARGAWVPGILYLASLAGLAWLGYYLAWLPFQAVSAAAHGML